MYRNELKQMAWKCSRLNFKFRKIDNEMIYIEFVHQGVNSPEDRDGCG